MGDDPGVLALLGFAFGTGLLHALEPDHLVAVTGLAAAGDRVRLVGTAARWATGHGAVLLAIGVPAYTLGVVVPAELGHAAEVLVGVVLVVVGLTVLVGLRRHGPHLHRHGHAHGSGVDAHVHWHTHPDGVHPPRSADVHDHGHDRAAGRASVVVGMIHGVAGSAPVLAFVPLAEIGSAWLAVAYLVVFGAAVVLAMTVLGVVVAALADRLTGRDVALSTARGLAGVGSVAVGGLWLTVVL